MINLLQKTIANKISCNSIGLHSGCNVNLTFKPADENTGIIFKRTDLAENQNVIKARYTNVTTTNLGTTITNEFGATISTIEHLMASIWGCGIDNMIIEVDNVEIPIMDGSSEPFVFLIECAGIINQSENRKVIEILENIRIEDNDKFIEVFPNKELVIDISVDFNHSLITDRNLNYHSNLHSFKNNICRARTFCFKSEIETMHKVGLAKGGSLDNAIVIDNDKILNNEKLRYDDEFIRHKTLDFIGDLFLAGYHIIGHFKAHKVGHTINNKFLHHLFDNPRKWRLV